MCLTIAHIDLGAADVLLDPAEGLLVLRPALTPGERLKAARRILRAAGVAQPGTGVTCRCGDPLPVTGCDEPTVRRQHVWSLAIPAAMCLAVGLMALDTSAATADETPCHRHTPATHSARL